MLPPESDFPDIPSAPVDPELVIPSRPPAGFPFIRYGRSSSYITPTVPPASTFPTLQDWHAALLSTYLFNEKIYLDQNRAQVNYCGSHASMPLTRDLWMDKLEALGLRRVPQANWQCLDNFMFLAPSPDPWLNRTAEFKIKSEAEARKIREAHALEYAKIETARRAGLMSPAELPRHTLGALTRWSKEREHFILGHQVYHVGDRLTVQTIDHEGNYIPLEDGLSSPTLAALRTAITRGKAGRLPVLPAHQHKTSKKGRKRNPPKTSEDWL